MWVVAASLGIIALIFGMVLWAGWRGEALASSRAARDLEQARADGLDDQIEMHREATQVEREAAGLPDDAALKEAMKWSRPPSS